MNLGILELLRRIYLTLPERFRSKALMACILLVLQSLAEILSLGTIVPAVPALMSPDTFFRQGVGARIYSIVGIGSPVVLSCLMMTGIVLVFALKNFFVHFVNRFQSAFVFDVYADLSTQLYEHRLSSGLLSIRSQLSANMARDVSGVAFRFTGMLMMPFIQLLTEVVVILLLSTAILWWEPWAFIMVGGGLCPLFGLFYLRTKRLIQSMEARIYDIEARLSGVVYQSLFGYTDVVATGSQSFFSKRFTRLAKEYAEGMAKRTVLGFMPTRLAEMGMIVGLAILYFYSTLRIDGLPERLALFGVYLVAAYRLLPSGSRITLYLLTIRGSAFALDVIEQLPKSTVLRNSSSKESITFKQEIAFENVSFKYPNASASILEKANVKISKGECLGIMGPSGAGKSTFLNLLLGLLDPTEGDVRVDGIPLKATNIESWRRLTGYVQQEVFIIDGTLLENIAFGVEEDDVKRDRVDRAVRLSALTDLIDGLPKGLLTPVAERGASLSVGQKQRLGIARALYHGAEIIVFDEATSALDKETEKEITASIQNLLQAGFTLIIVSHREQPLTVCNRVIQLGEGSLFPKNERTSPSVSI